MSHLPLSVRAFGIGFACGMRSMLGPALVRREIAADSADSPLHTAATSPLAATLMPILAVGELIGDKLPNTPNRTFLPSVVFRTASGASSAASLYELKRESIATGAVLGAVGALAATYGVFHLRRAASQQNVAPNLVLGLIEDAAAIGLGLWILRDTNQQQ